MVIGANAVSPTDLLKQFPEFVDTFVNGLFTGVGGWSVSGTGSVSQVAPPTANAGRNDVIGVLNLATGTATTGRYGAILGQNLLRFDAPGVYSAWSRVYFPQFSDNTNKFRFQFGFKDNNNGDPTDGAFFEYDKDINGGDKWSLNTVSNGTRTRQILANTFNMQQWYDLQVEVTTVGNMAKFYIDDVQVGNTIYTNIPNTGGRETSVGFEIRKLLGGTTRSVYLDYVYIKRSRV